MSMHVCVYIYVVNEKKQTGSGKTSQIKMLLWDSHKKLLSKTLS